MNPSKIELLPGQSLTLRGLGKAYGVSMTPAREAVRRLVAEWTGAYQYTIDQVLADMIARADELNLRLREPEDATVQDFTVLVTVQTMNYLHSGRHRVAL